ncbi:hypothetical protein A9P82_14920 [Arachidicoccus ginsenosidimutans]|uniref:NAD-dependent epimerase/dehydratase family protein n=1 Tax=Arachidicoccus sp. BS20 TaxID=1850526 RepID=UPI0007F09112|nr:NAD-dependent epimerase/dehydratase family protein [Arachidicoccus sp. BS20]ANI90464.1 hypothetical protein A9P82_14920 [Arachidicoccus sp. BS20]
MILGKGLIGTALQAIDRNDVLFCASGVSNLFGHIEEQRLREENLLRENIAKYNDKTIIYFSSYSISDSDDAKNTPYLLHKKRMENLVKELASQYVIARTSNVVGKNGQAGNLTNFIYKNLTENIPFDIWTNTNRNLIDVEHLALMTDYYLKNHSPNKTIFIVNPKDIMIEDVVKAFELKLSLKANYQLLNKGNFYFSDKTFAEEAFAALNIDDENYTENLIEKYFL